MLVQYTVPTKLLPHHSTPHAVSYPSTQQWGPPIVSHLVCSIQHLQKFKIFLFYVRDGPIYSAPFFRYATHLSKNPFTAFLPPNDTHYLYANMPHICTSHTVRTFPFHTPKTLQISFKSFTCAFSLPFLQQYALFVTHILRTIFFHTPNILQVSLENFNCVFSLSSYGR